MDRFVHANPTASVVGRATKQRMLVERAADVKKAEDDLEKQSKLVEKRENEYKAANSNRILAEKSLQDFEEQITIEKQNVKDSRSKLDAKEKEIQEVEKRIREILAGIETIEQKHQELKDKKADLSNEMNLRKQEMTLDQHRLDFLANNIK
ncbi:unnamed protein product, partial [Adineta ricciae]